MNKITLLLFLLAVITSCTRQHTPAKTAVNIPEGYYKGGDQLFTIAYLQVMKDTVFADFIHIDKFARNLYSDTLVYDGSNQIWKGSTKILYKKRGAYYISTKEPFFAGKLKVKFESNEAVYQQQIDKHKNVALLRKHYEDYINANVHKAEAEKRYDELKTKYDLPSLVTLKHADFLKALATFTLALEKE
jgi:hypothetical protein